MFIWVLLVVFVAAFTRVFVVEVRRTSWSLLEALIMVNIVGHVIAWPIAYTISNDLLKDEYWHGALLIFSGLVCATCMIGGAVWTLRRLKAKGENRTGVRILYLLLGLLLFPSIIAFPVGWLVWIPLLKLHYDTEHLLRRSR